MLKFRMTSYLFTLVYRPTHDKRGGGQYQLELDAVLLIKTEANFLCAQNAQPLWNQ